MRVELSVARDASGRLCSVDSLRVNRVSLGVGLESRIGRRDGDAEHGDGLASRRRWGWLRRWPRAGSAHAAEPAVWAGGRDTRRPVRAHPPIAGGEPLSAAAYAGVEP